MAVYVLPATCDMQSTARSKNKTVKAKVQNCDRAVEAHSSKAAAADKMERRKDARLKNVLV